MFSYGKQNKMVAVLSTIQKQSRPKRNLKSTKSKKIEKDVICKIKGDWLENLDFDNITYWHVDKKIPKPIIPIEVPLPSDGRFREDLIWLFRAFNTQNEKEKTIFEEYSQQWKLMMELTQRNDRELRKK